MKTIAKLGLAVSLLALGACTHSDNGGAKMQSYDEQAPYSHERTVGTDTVTTKADHMYNAHQNK